MPTMMPTYPMTGYNPGQSVWVDWQGTTTTGFFQPATAATNVWNYWMDSPYPQTTVYPQQYVWTQWVDTQFYTPNQLRGFASADYNAAAAVAPFISEDERRRQEEERRRRDLIFRTRSHVAGLRRKLAARRARDLLLDFLDAEQARELEQSGYFHVITAGGLRKYRISKGHAGNIRLVEIKGAAAAPRGRSGYPLRIGARFCMHGYHPDGVLPDEDHMLAQKLLLEADEAEFLRLANVS